MAETETENEPTLPSKRKLDDPINESKQEEQNHSNKSQKLQSPAEEENNKDSQTLEAPLAVNQNDAVEAQEDEDEDDDDVDYENEAENGDEAVVVDRKGKGIMIEESNDSDDSDDDDDDSSDGSETDGGDSDNEVDEEDEEEENPLAEVDLENILSSRTRRRVVRPGVYIANDNLANKDDDSDDSDA